MQGGRGETNHMGLMGPTTIPPPTCGAPPPLCPPPPYTSTHLWCWTWHPHPLAPNLTEKRIPSTKHMHDTIITTHPCTGPRGTSCQQAAGSAGPRGTCCQQAAGGAGALASEPKSSSSAIPKR